MKKLILIDANSLIHRMYHAMPQLNDKDNNPAGAIYGLSNVLLKIKNEISPEYAVALFDRPEPTFRKQEFKEYKAHRPKADEELIEQIIKAHDVFDAFSVHTIEKPGYEADDLIGTLAEKFKNEKNLKVIIFTGDLDSLQLVDDGKVVVETFKKGISETIEYNSEEVYKKLGVYPEKVIDYKAIVGDKSDNIPGASGVGPKGATHILSKFDSLEDYFKNGEEDKLYEKIIKQKDQVILSKKLATIIKDVPISTDLFNLEINYDDKKIIEYFNSMGFNSLVKRMIVNKDIKENDLSNNKKSKNISKSKDKDFIILDENNNKQVNLNSSDLKVGFSIKDIYKKNKFIPPFADIEIGFQLLGEKFKNYEELSALLFSKILEKRDFLISAFSILKDRIKKEKSEYVFWDIEMPLIPIIAEMEKRGISIDKESLEDVEKRISKEVDKKRSEILKKMGEDINLNSPKQLLEYFKSKGAKIKSTSADRLEKIKEEFPIIEEILEYRSVFKLKTTYLDPYKEITDDNSRVHPTFLQLGASTGRLSCQSPNLQNIPQESEWSNDIRNIFSAPDEWSLASFDYSQIELRVLASLSEDKNMIDAFNNGDDIHRLTAQKVFGLDAKDVSNQRRRIAKTLNFGIIYGMGPRAFSKQAGISMKEAKEFIEKYFNNFPSIKMWQSKILDYARANNRTVNQNGRFRKLPSINSPNQMYSSEAERMAINMPLQSLAADIIKLAMIEVDKKIKEKALGDDVKMILTIHDELIFEINNKIIEKDKESEVLKDIKSWMEGVYELKVPLIADIKLGHKWGELK